MIVRVLRKKCLYKGANENPFWNDGAFDDDSQDTFNR